MVPLQTMPLRAPYQGDLLVFIKSVTDRNSPHVLRSARCGIHFASFPLGFVSFLPLDNEGGHS